MRVQYARYRYRQNRTHNRQKSRCTARVPPSPNRYNMGKSAYSATQPIQTPSPCPNFQNLQKSFHTPLIWILPKHKYARHRGAGAHISFFYSPPTQNSPAMSTVLLSTQSRGRRFPVRTKPSPYHRQYLGIRMTPRN